MTKILHVNSSPRGQESRSLAIAETFLDAYQDATPDAKVDTWNLFDERLPDFGTIAASAKMAAFAGQGHTSEQAEVWTQARAILDRFIDADVYVFNVPMWNHGVPYVLKHWIDLITQPGWVFGFDPASGYSGLVEGKRAVVVYTSGVYQPGGRPGFGSDFHATFFTDWLRFIGITDVSEIRHDGNVMDPDPVASLRAHRERARGLATTFAN